MRNLIKNFFLSNFHVADLLFKILRKIPKKLYNIIIDFYFLLPQSDKLFPSRLTFFLTDKCNMKCSHCFIIKEIPKKTLELDLNQYKKIFKSLKGRTSQILFTGGEPTLRKDFFDILYYAHTLGKVSTVSIFSNSLFPESIKSLIEKLIIKTKLKIHYHTSIDGEETFHDLNRRVPKSFQKVKETIKILNELRNKHNNRLSRIVVNVSISKYNCTQLEKVIDEFKNLNCLFGFGFTRHNNRVINIDPKYITDDLGVEELKSDGTNKFSNGFLDVDEMKNIYDNLSKNIWKHNAEELIYAFQKVSMKGRIEFDANNKSPISVECKMGYDDLVVLTNGKIARCEMLKPIANLKDFDFDLSKFFNHEVAKDYLKNTSGCFCEHECATSVTAMSDKKLLKSFFDN